ncbi:hypothetical protein H4582DRAFT_656140 [Lactarius indigo]|nr:hypothetical protein H4582DRAFT_656140 [Lactarius indigo]
MKKNTVQFVRTVAGMIYAYGIAESHHIGTNTLYARFKRGPFGLAACLWPQFFKLYLAHRCPYGESKQNTRRYKFLLLDSDSRGTRTSMLSRQGISSDFHEVISQVNSLTRGSPFLLPIVAVTYPVPGVELGLFVYYVTGVTQYFLRISRTTPFDYDQAGVSETTPLSLVSC